jgi:hypothetical protein
MPSKKGTNTKTSEADIDTKQTHQVRLTLDYSCKEFIYLEKTR